MRQEREREREEKREIGEEERERAWPLFTRDRYIYPEPPENGRKA